MIQNLNPDFNPIWLQTIMESIQQMAPKGFPLIALAQQGAEVVNVVVAHRSTGNPRGKYPSATDQTIGEREPKAKQHLRQAVTAV
jgi:hypothetical protein